MNYERRLSKEDREIYNCLKPFARFISDKEFQNLFEGLILEKNLRQRLNQLKAYKKIGLKTYDDIEKHLENESRNKKEEKKNNINLDYEPIGLRLDKFHKKFHNKMNLENELEKILIKENGFSKSNFEDIKKAIIKELIIESSNIYFKKVFLYFFVK